MQSAVKEVRSTVILGSVTMISDFVKELPQSRNQRLHEAACVRAQEREVQKLDLHKKEEMENNPIFSSLDAMEKVKEESMLRKYILAVENLLNKQYPAILEAEDSDMLV